jgi:hypothetical protein
VVQIVVRSCEGGRGECVDDYEHLSSISRSVLTFAGAGVEMKYTILFEASLCSEDMKQRTKRKEHYPILDLNLVYSLLKLVHGIRGHLLPLSYFYSLLFLAYFIPPPHFIAPFPSHAT